LQPGSARITFDTMQTAVQTRESHPAHLTIVVALSVVFLSQGLQTPAQSFQLNPAREGIILGSGLLFAGLGELLVSFSHPMVTTPPDISRVPIFDQAAMFRYSKDADTVSSVLQFATLSVPLLLSVSAKPDSNISAGVVYAESLALAYGTKNVLKFLFPRARPYNYNGGAPGVDSSEDEQSFPSGHATMSFTAAAFSSYLFSRGLPGTANYFPFVIVNFSLAGLTSSYRVLSGMHFLSDIVAGAVIGVVCGFVVPSLIRGL
jgi:membrane-associated phospholipid phosphatase